MRAALLETAYTRAGPRSTETHVFAVVEDLPTCPVSWKVHARRWFAPEIADKYPSMLQWRWKIADIFGRDLDPHSVKGKAVVASCEIARLSERGVFEPI